MSSTLRKTVLNLLPMEMHQILFIIFDCAGKKKNTRYPIWFLPNQDANMVCWMPQWNVFNKLLGGHFFTHEHFGILLYRKEQLLWSSINQNVFCFDENKKQKTSKIHSNRFQSSMERCKAIIQFQEKTLKESKTKCRVSSCAFDFGLGKKGKMKCIFSLLYAQLYLFMWLILMSGLIFSLIRYLFFHLELTLVKEFRDIDSDSTQHRNKLHQILMNSKEKHKNLPFRFVHLLFSHASWQVCVSLVFVLFYNNFIRRSTIVNITV